MRAKLIILLILFFSLILFFKPLGEMTAAAWNSIFLQTITGNVTVTDTTPISITNFTVPSTVQSGSSLSYSVTAQNIGLVNMTNVSITVNIYNCNSVLKNTDSTPGSHTLAPLETLLFSSSWTASGQPNCDFTAQAIVYFNVSDSIQQNETFQITTPGGGGQQGGGGGGGAVISSESEAATGAGGGSLSVTEGIIATEFPPAEKQLIPFKIKNAKNSKSGVAVSILNAPENWKIAVQNEVTLEPKQEKTLELEVEAPEDAAADEYIIDIDMNIDNEETLQTKMLLRLKSYAEADITPRVFKTIKLSHEKDKAYVKLKVKNQGQKIDQMELIEEIPKELAADISFVQFNQQPVIIQADPKVKWVFENLEPDEEFDVTYTLLKNSKLYEHYFNWIGESVSVIYAAPAEEEVKNQNIMFSILIISGILLLFLLFYFARKHFLKI